jgi:hypothetical protein
MQQRTGRMDAPSAPPRAPGRDAVDMLAEIPLSRSSLGVTSPRWRVARPRSASHPSAPLVRVGEPKIALAIMATLTGRLRALQAATL